MATVLGSCLSRRHDLPLKAWLAAMVLLVPHSGEVFFNPTNAQWVAALGILITTLKNDPARPREWFADLGFVFVAGLSGPFIIFVAPFFAIRFVLRKSRASGVLFGAAVLAAAVQMGFIAHAPTDREFSGPFTLLGLFANVCFRLPCNAFFGVLITAAAGQVVRDYARPHDPRLYRVCRLAQRAASCGFILARRVRALPARDDHSEKTLRSLGFWRPHERRSLFLYTKSRPAMGSRDRFCRGANPLGQVDGIRAHGVQRRDQRAPIQIRDQRRLWLVCKVRRDPRRWRSGSRDQSRLEVQISARLAEQRRSAVMRTSPQGGLTH